MVIRSSIAAIATVTLITTGCSSGAERREPAPGTTSASSVSGTATPPPAVNPADIHGPVFTFCHHAGVIDVKKLNLATRQLIDIAHFPENVKTGCSQSRGRTVLDDSGDANQFSSQLYRTMFSRDFQEAIASAPTPGKVAYYDLKSGNVVVASDFVPHPTGDFETDPTYEGGYFTEDGLLTFRTANQNPFNKSHHYYFFNTETRSIARESDEPEFPTFLRPAMDMDSTARNGYATLSTAGGAWLINPKSYIMKDYFDDQHNKVGWVLWTMPPNHYQDHGKLIQEISPKNASIEQAAADPQGSIILMLIAGRGDMHKLYQVNLQNPNAPTEINLNGALGKSYADPEINIVAWE